MKSRIAEIMASAIAKIAKIVEVETKKRATSTIMEALNMPKTAAKKSTRTAAAEPADKPEKAVTKKRCPHTGCRKHGTGPRFGFYCAEHREGHGYATKGKVPIAEADAAPQEGAADAAPIAE